MFRKSWVRRLFFSCVAGMVFTGFAQMPITKRYYISDLPGLGWSADFYTVLNVHLVLAALLLFWCGLMAAAWFGEKRKTPLGPKAKRRIFFYGAVFVSGGLLAAGNFSGFTWEPGAYMALKLSHLGLVMLLGAAGLAGLLRRRRGRPGASGGENAEA